MIKAAPFKQAKSASVAKGETLRMLRNKMLIKPIECDRHSGLTVIDNRERKPVRGVVVAIGPGKRPIRRYKNDQGQYYAYDELPGLIPTELKVGEEVELMPNAIKMEVVMAGELHYMVDEDDAAGAIP